MNRAIDRHGVEGTFFAHSDAHDLLVLRTLLRAAPSPRIVHMLHIWVAVNTAASAFFITTAVLLWLAS